jgi:HEPN domain-containing protein
VNRKQLQAVAETRVKDALLLYQQRRFAGVYYLAGYAIECALKACIAKRTKRHDFPDKELAQAVYTHDLTQLLKHAGLGQQLQLEFRNDRILEVRWGVVKDWNEKSRYESHGRSEARSLLEAVADGGGVFACLKKYW